MAKWYTSNNGDGITNKKPVTPAADMNTQKDLAERFVTVTADLAHAPVCYGQVQVGCKMFAFHWNPDTSVITTGFIVADGGAAGIDGFVSVLFNGKSPDAGILLNQYLGTQNQTADPLLAAAITGYTDTLAGLAYIVLQMPAGVMDTWPQVTCEIRGLKVYNPKTATTAYSKNPALCLGDLIRSTDYGRGTAVDDLALEAAQDACDTLIGGEVRRTICISLDEQKMVDDWIDILRAYAGCWVDYRGSTAFLIPDRPPEVLKSFYNWADRGHSAVIDSAALTSSQELGELVGAPYVPTPTDFNADGVLMPSLTGLRWNIAYVNQFSDTGFTMHFEVESRAFDSAIAGSATVYGDSLGTLWNLSQANQQLGFFKKPSALSWSDIDGNLPVLANDLTEATHINYDFSITKLAVGYQLDVYLDRTLWYSSTNANILDLSASYLGLSGFGGFGPTNPVARIKNVLLIRGPVNPYAGVQVKSCIGVGDSNMFIPTYQSADTSGLNNPLVIGTIPNWPGALNSSGNVFLNSGLQDKGIAASDGSGMQRFFDASQAGWSLAPNAPPNTYQTLETIVSDVLGVPRASGNTATAARPRPQNPPEWWFTDMGGNDMGIRANGTDNGYPVLSDWVTYLCDLFIVQIKRMLASSADAKVFVSSSARIYELVSGGSWTNPNDYVEILATENQAIIAEFSVRLPAIAPGRVFYYDLYTTWNSTYNAFPGATAGYYPGVHFNAEGYRRMSMGFASIVPSPLASIALNAADIIKGSLTIKKGDSAEIPTVVRVGYSNTTGGEWVDARSDPAQIPGVGSGAVQRRESLVNMNGITRHSQAYREAIERLNKLTLSDLSVSFTMFDNGLRLVIGDVFTLTHPIGLSAKLLRVIEPPLQSSIGRWEIEAIEYDAAAYSDIVITEPSTPDTSLPVNSPPAAVTGLAITETTYQIQSGDFPSRLDICWNPSANLYVTGYSVVVLDGVTPVFTTTAANSINSAGMVCASTSPLQELKTYTVEVRALSSLYVGTAATASHELIGKFELPDAPASISGFEVGGEVRLSWVKSTDIDARRYWLRYSTPAQTWDDGIDLDQVDALRLNTKDVPEGTFRIWVKTIDSVGGVSPDSAYVDVVVTRDNNAFAAGDLDPMAAGTVTNMAVGKEKRTSSVQQYYSDSGQSCTAVFGGGSLAALTANILSYQTMPAAGATFFSSELDLLLDQAAGFVLRFDYTDLSGTAVPQLGLKPDGGSYTFGNTSQQGTARFAQGKITSGGALKVNAPAGYLRADVQAREETKTDTTVTSGPKKITLSTRYAAVRSIALTPQGTVSVSVSYDNIILNGASGKTEFDIYAFNTITGAQVAVPVQWQFKGV